MEINGYPNYLVYDDGRVFSKKRRIFLKSGINSSDYHIVILGNDGKRKTFQVHRLVALHYIPNPDNKPHVDHIDRNPLNNHFSNLRWVTRSENQQNRGVRKDNKSTGIKNIHYDKGMKSYRYDKKIRGERYSKRFKTLEEAIACKEEYEEEYE